MNDMRNLIFNANRVWTPLLFLSSSLPLWLLRSMPLGLLLLARAALLGLQGRSGLPTFGLPRHLVSLYFALAIRRALSIFYP